MKKLTLVAILIILTSQLNLFGQIIPSSCEADSSYTNFTNHQAPRLAIRWLRASSSPDTALLNIPNEEIISIEKALNAVYNAHELSGYDTIMLSYTRFPDLNHYVILCDTNTIWAEQWKQGNLLTGDPAMDSLLLFLEFEFIKYEFDASYEGAFIEFYTEKTNNVYAVSNKFLTFSGIEMAYTFDTNCILESKRLNYKKINEIRRLTYSYGWGDCIAGCTNWKHWNINVYPDCSVEIVGHNAPVYTNIDKNEDQLLVKVYPNPIKRFANFDFVLPQPAPVLIEFYNQFGEKVDEIRKDQSEGKQSIEWNTNDLNKGIYYFRLKTGNINKTGKLILIN
jgi:hypothetical protein